MSDVFVSYSSQDRARVVPLVQALERRGWTTVGVMGGARGVERADAPEGRPGSNRVRRTVDRFARTKEGIFSRQ